MAKRIDKPEVYTKTSSNENFMKREQAQKIDFAKIQEILQRNVSKNVNKSFTQYTKDLIKQYVQSPLSSIDTLREVSRFLSRVSMIYKKLIAYYATMPLFYYNVTPLSDISAKINKNKTLKDYQSVLERIDKFNFQKEFYTVISTCIRDGMYAGFAYETEKDGFFLMSLDVKYCRIYGKTEDGEWIVYFDASYFDSGNNKDFVLGVNGDGVGVWDKCFVDGYRNYKENGRDYQWFRLTPEKTFCMTANTDDEFYMPLPYFLPLFVSLLDLIDMEQLLMSKTELENYVLLLSKIPIISSTNDVDDFAISLELAQTMQSLIDAVVPELVGTAYSPMDVDVIRFDKSNSTADTDHLSESMANLFNNAGISQLVVSGGSSSNASALRHALQNDMSNAFVYVNRIESWLNFYIKHNISEGYKLKIHRITWYNEDNYIQQLKDAATLGGSAMDYLTALGDTPYNAWNKLQFENAVGIKSIMIPLASSYNSSTVATSQNKGGAPTKNLDDLSEEGEKTRDGSKNDI